MERAEAQTRIDAALATLRSRGWNSVERERLVDGLHRDDAVQAAESAVQANCPVWETDDECAA